MFPIYQVLIFFILILIRIEVTSYTFSLQEQYKTIYLTLHEMLKVQIPIQNTMEFLQKLESAKIDLPANDSLIRKEVQVFVYSCKTYFRDLNGSSLDRNLHQSTLRKWHWSLWDLLTRLIFNQNICFKLTKIKTVCISHCILIYFSGFWQCSLSTQKRITNLRPITGICQAQFSLVSKTNGYTITWKHLKSIFYFIIFSFM